MQVVFRVDSNKTMRIGHFMRCLSFAQFFRDENIKVNFVTTTRSGYLLKMLEEENIGIVHGKRGDPQEDINWTLNYLKSLKTVDLFVLDGYHFDTEYHDAVKCAGVKLLCIDDLAQIHFACDYVLNQNLGSSTLDYSMAPHTKLLLGPKYWLWRREFRKAPCKEKASLLSKKVSKIFVTLGGGDVTSQLTKILKYLGIIDLSPDLHFKISTGHSDELLLAKVADQLSCRVELIPHINNMSEIILWADLAITGAGTTLYEVLYLGTPALICVLADHQIASASEVFKLQMGLFLEINKFDCFSKTFRLILESYPTRMAIVDNQKKHFQDVGIAKDIFYEIFN